ncbi:helix-turn-helix transcriptional regulator [Mycoplasmatota bacterium]|nr:helix-turn-helix transcriptional regulator [Mycoplasmatota bacterium]
MNIRGFEKLINEREVEQNELSKNKTLATTIRRRRKEMNYTQGQVSKGICSVSYLSKIENGHLEPENYYVQEIMNRIGIGHKEISNAVYVEEVKAIVKAMFYEESDVIVKIYDDVSADENSNILSAELIFLGKCLYFGELERSLELIKTINLVKKDLINYELKVFIYFIALFESMNLRNKYAMNYLKILSSLEDSDPNLCMLILILKAKVTIYLGQYVLAMSTINNIECRLINNMNLNKLIKIKLDHVFLLTLSKQTEDAWRVLDRVKRYMSVDSTVLERVHFITGWLYKVEGDYEKAITSFSNACDQLYFESISNIVECYYYLENYSSMNEFVQMIDENKEDKRYEFYHKLVSYFSVKSNGHLYDCKEYVTRQLMPMMKKVKYNYYYNLFSIDLIEYHRTNGRYKEIDKIRNKL